MGSGTVAPVVIDFKRDIEDPATETNNLLRNTSDRTKVSKEFYTTAISNIASKAEGAYEVIIKVPRRSNQWTPRLEQAVRDRLALCQSPTRGPVRLKVVLV